LLLQHGVRALFVLILLSSVLTSVAWGGGALDRFEKPHRPSRSSDDDDDSSSSSSSRSRRSSSDDRSHDGGWYSSDDDDGVSSSGESLRPSDEGLEVLAFVPCLVVPLFAPACLHPVHFPSREPYHRRGLYVEPREPRSEVSPALMSESTFTPEDADRKRWFELEASGFRAFNEEWILTHQLRMHGYFGAVTLRASWEHFYEQLPTGAFDHLDLLRFHTGANLLGPWVEQVELWGLAGALLMKGNEVTPAFDVGAELRIYPREPLAMHSSAIFTIFEHGPVLVDTRWELGVVLGRFEVRAGPRWLYQGEAQGFWGPSASLATRF
jgi:hypothetical protein